MTDMESLETAAALVRCLWDGIPNDYKSKYRREIWEQVQSRVAAHAKMTATLATWLSRVCLTFDGAQVAPYHAEQRAWFEGQLRMRPDAQQRVLRTLREQAPVVILLLRNQLQEEKEVAAS